LQYQQYSPLSLLYQCLTSAGLKEEADYVSGLHGQPVSSVAHALTILENRLPADNSWRAVLLAKAAITGRTEDAHEKLFWLKWEMEGFPREVVEEMTDNPPAGE
jgi:hypothetical protein